MMESSGLGLGLTTVSNCPPVSLACSQPGLVSQAHPVQPGPGHRLSLEEEPVQQMEVTASA